LIKIPYQRLSPAALRGVIDEFVQREGTDYGHRDFTLDEKRATVLAALESGRAIVTFEPVTGTTSIVDATLTQGP
jgi:uncharacterized protein YheU (UPF0270 family)